MSNHDHNTPPEASAQGHSSPATPPAPDLREPIAIPRPVPVDRVMVEHRARELASRSIKAESKAAGLRLAVSMLDLTTLEGADSPEKVRALCRRAIRPCPQDLSDPVPSVAAVCVYPNLVPVAKATLAGTNVRIAAVATAFPSGQFPIDVRLRDVASAIELGAHEIDMVINRGSYLRGDLGVVADEIRAVRQVCHDLGAHLKIILETGELETYENVRRASDVAIAAATSGDLGRADAWEDGCVFIKTSTGKISPAATMPVTLIMLHAIRDHYLRTGQRVGMKPAGGIRTSKDALRYLVMVKETLGDAWLRPSLFRFGASSLTDDLIRQILKIDGGSYAAPYDVARS